MSSRSENFSSGLLGLKADPIKKVGEHTASHRCRRVCKVPRYSCTVRCSAWVVLWCACMCVRPVHDQCIAHMCRAGGPPITRALPLPRTKGHVMVLDLSAITVSNEGGLGDLGRRAAKGGGNGPDHDLRDRSGRGI